MEQVEILKEMAQERQLAPSARCTTAEAMRPEAKSSLCCNLIENTGEEYADIPPVRGVKGLEVQGGNI